MLSKWQNAPLSLWNTVTVYSKGQTSWFFKSYTYTSDSFNGAGIIHFYAYIYFQWTNGDISLKIDNNIVWTQHYTNNAYISIDQGDFIIAWGEHTVSFVFASWNSDSSYSLAYSGCNLTAYLDPKIMGINWNTIPIDVNNIWEKSIVNIFWKNENENFNQFFVWIEENEVTTWNITPWNFVGYINLWGYKIPYYL